MIDLLDPQKAATAKDATEKRTSRRWHDYSPEIAELICNRIAEGASVRRICQDANMPARSTIFCMRPFKKATSIVGATRRLPAFASTSSRGDMNEVELAPLFRIKQYLEQWTVRENALPVGLRDRGRTGPRSERREAGPHYFQGRVH
jgi:hypothetical protein